MGIQRVGRAAIAAAVLMVLAFVVGCEKELAEPAPVVRPIKILTVQGGGAGRQ